MKKSLRCSNCGKYHWIVEEGDEPKGRGLTLTCSYCGNHMNFLVH